MINNILPLNFLKNDLFVKIEFSNDSSYDFLFYLFEHYMGRWVLTFQKELAYLS